MDKKLRNDVVSGRLRQDFDPIAVFRNSGHLDAVASGRPLPKLAKARKVVEQHIIATFTLNGSRIA